VSVHRPTSEGQVGDRACFRVTCLLAEAGYGFTEALAEMEWSRRNATPPWEVKELARKFRYAFARITSAV
jgi:hypothetical protein